MIQGNQKMRTVFVQVREGGGLPDAEAILEHGQDFDLFVLHETARRNGEYVDGLYRKGTSPGGEYDPSDEAELKRFIRQVHGAGKRVVLYVSPYYWTGTRAAFYTRCHQLHQLGADGFYLDGLDMDSADLSDEIMDAMRRIVGKGGLLVAHVSNVLLPMPLRRMPGVEAWADLVVTGENWEHVPEWEHPYYLFVGTLKDTPEQIAEYAHRTGGQVQIWMAWKEGRGWYLASNPARRVWEAMQ